MEYRRRYYEEVVRPKTNAKKRPPTLSPEERIERKRASDRKYYARNREKLLAYHESRRPIYNTQRRARYRDIPEHREKTKAYVLRRQALHHNADKKHLLELQGGRCAYCGCNLKALPQRMIHMDHVMPRSRGGPNDPLNYILACSRCNEQKKDKHPFDFIWRRGVCINPCVLPQGHALMEHLIEVQCAIEDMTMENLL
jgi:5-methylcytosine-specific restriction endonuclease McrA